MAVPIALSPHHREIIVRILEAALRAVDPLEAVKNQLSVAGNMLRIGTQDYPLDELERILVVGGGKAGTPMAAAVYGLSLIHI
ncbi:MAG: glycerate-2-kinase family protein, partial [Anaerolineae bacterium]|nr:glycerate-2-kinase family protein [Anaerolineae bacterium]